MQTDSDAELADGAPVFLGEGFQRLQGAGDRIAAVKGSRDAVAGVFGDPAPSILDGALQEGIVVDNDLTHRRWVQLPQPT